MISQIFLSKDIKMVIQEYSIRNFKAKGKICSFC